MGLNKYDPEYWVKEMYLMMISPAGFLELHKDKSYAELLPVRDNLVRRIRSFEKRPKNPDSAIVSPSPEVVYQCNLEYLGELCKLISEKYNQEFIWGSEK